MAFGRPTKYPKTKKKEIKLCELLVEHGAQGHSFETFGVTEEFVELIGSYCVKSILHDWVKIHPDFSAAKDLFEQRSRLYWDKLGKEFQETLVQNPKSRTYSRGASAVYLANMRNRFKWDRKDIDDGPVDTDEKEININFFEKTDPDPR